MRNIKKDLEDYNRITEGNQKGRFYKDDIDQICAISAGNIHTAIVTALCAGYAAGYKTAKKKDQEKPNQFERTLKLHI